MRDNKKHFFLCLMTVPLFILSCSGGAEESALAKQVSFTTSKVAVVLPNKLSSTAGQTCMAADVSGPSVRLNASMTWSGTGNLLPLVIRLTFTDSRIASTFTGSVSPSDSDSESLAESIFGLTTDYFSPGETGTTSTCFLDYGSLPKPVTEVKGSTQLQIPVTLTMIGVVRDTQNNDTPVVKEIDATITYMAGSVP